MYAKVFTQIFDSSIAEDYEVRHMFEDLLKLSDKDGFVDMTMEAIQRRTNVPMEVVKRCIEELEKPDYRSRSRECDGRRIVRMDAERGWGWKIVNYVRYRGLQDEESRREYNREAQKKHREKEKEKRRRSGMKKMSGGGPIGGEESYRKAQERGAGEEELGRIADPEESLEARRERNGALTVEALKELHDRGELDELGKLVDPPEI